MEKLTLGIAALTVTVILFKAPIIGVADQADYGRIMQAVLLDYPPQMATSERYFCHLQPTFVFVERKIGRSRIPYFSSELLFVGLAVALHSTFLGSPDFDIRTLGLVHAAAFIAVLGLLLARTRRLALLGRFVACVVAMFILCDVGYISYFNSFYSESASLIFGLGFVGATFLLLEACTRWRLLLWFASAAMLVTAKTQNIPLTLPIAIYAALEVFGLERSQTWRAFSAAGISALLGISAFSIFRTPQAMKRAAIYNSIYSGLLPLSPDRQGDLRKLGLPPGSAHQVNTNYWNSPNPGATGNASHVHLALFYLKHPDRLFALMSHAAGKSLSTRYSALGNFERSSGMPCQSQAQSFAGWDRHRRNLGDIWLLTAFFAANVIGLARIWNQSLRRPITFHLLIIAMAVVSFATAALGDGIETQKHLFFFTFLFDVCLIADAIWLCYLIAPAPRTAPAP